jgi:hypothetical protein
MMCSFVSSEPHSLISQNQLSPSDYHLPKGLNRNLGRYIFKDVCCMETAVRIWLIRFAYHKIDNNDFRHKQHVSLKLFFHQRMR